VSGQHTPTPWVQNFTTVVASHGAFGTHWSQEPEIATCVLLPIKGAAHANAAFIVRACNAHDALVSVVKDLIQIADAHVGEKFCREARKLLESLGEVEHES